MECRFCEVADDEVALREMPGRVIRPERAGQMLERLLVAAVPQRGKAARPLDVCQLIPDAQRERYAFDLLGERLDPVHLAAHRRHMGLDRPRRRRQGRLRGLFTQATPLVRVARRQVPTVQAPVDVSANYDRRRQQRGPPLRCLLYTSPSPRD